MTPKPAGRGNVDMPQATILGESHWWLCPSDTLSTRDCSLLWILVLERSRTLLLSTWIFFWWREFPAIARRIVVNSVSWKGLSPFQMLSRWLHTPPFAHTMLHFDVAVAIWHLSRLSGFLCCSFKGSDLCRPYWSHVQIERCRRYTLIPCYIKHDCWFNALLCLWLLYQILLLVS